MVEGRRSKCPLMLCYVWDTRDYKGETSLFIAAEQGKPHKVWWLLLRGADPNISAGINDLAVHRHATALYAAWLSGNKACVRLLTEYGGQLFVATKLHGTEELSLVQFFGRKEQRFELLNPQLSAKERQAQFNLYLLFYSLSG